MSFDSQYAFNHFYEILQAAPVAVLVTVVSAFLGLFGGMLFCVVRLRRIPVLNTIVGLLVSLIRSTPILVQLYVVCYGMPRIVAFVHQNPKFVSNVTISEHCSDCHVHALCQCVFLRDFQKRLLHGW